MTAMMKAVCLVDRGCSAPSSSVSNDKEMEEERMDHVVGGMNEGDEFSHELRVWECAHRFCNDKLKSLRSLGTRRGSILFRGLVPIFAPLFLFYDSLFRF